MAKIQFLTILLVVTCFLGGVVSVTDKEFEDIVALVHQQRAVVEEQTKTNKHQSDVIDKMSITIDKQAMANEQQSVLIQQLQEETADLTEKLKQQEVIIERLDSAVQCADVPNDLVKWEGKLLQNATIEERVSLLEIQVVVIQEDVTDLDEDVTLLEGNVNFLFDETVIQDERIFALEQTTDAINAELDLIDDEFDTLGNELESVQTSIFALDFRVTALEENGGGDGNSSVVELEMRVEVLEGTAAAHETRITTAETDIIDLEVVTSNHETRLTAAEENIQGLQMTDVQLDERVTALEENGGGGNIQNATVAFHSVLTSYSSIPVGSAVLFNEVLLNEGEGYDSSIGTFTVPPGGDGYYYFFVYSRVGGDESATFDVAINGERICTVFSDLTESPSTDPEITTCSGVTYTVEGDEVQVVYRAGTDMTPLVASSTYYYNAFTGFRI